MEESFQIWGLLAFSLTSVLGRQTQCSGSRVTVGDSQVHMTEPEGRSLDEELLPLKANQLLLSELLQARAHRAEITSECETSVITRTSA